MYKLDFLSQAPTNFIFEKESNKTILGGVLTLIYLAIVLLIIVAYMYDYSVNPKYSVLYNSENIYKSDPESKEARENDQNLNPKITFNIGLNLNKMVPEHYAILLELPNDEKGKILKFNENFTQNLYDISVHFYYRCKGVDKNGSCIFHDREKNKELNMYSFTFNYTGSKIDHQNENPLTEDFMQDDVLFSINDNMFYHFLKWKTVIYTEEKGIARLYDYLIGNSNEIYGGFFINPISYIAKRPESGKVMEQMGFLYLGNIGVSRSDNNNYFDYYSRTKIGIFDPISSICSLCLIIYNAFIFIFGKLYSQNYDNYKMIENILSKNEKPLKKSEKDSEVLNISDNKEALLDTSVNNNEDNAINSEKEEENNDENKNEEENNKDSIISPKLYFYNFIFNNVYMKKCCFSNTQEFIITCDKIIKKYNSAENIVYHQMMLENLLKDYKWNNPKLKVLKNNELIKDLKLLS